MKVALVRWRDAWRCCEEEMDRADCAEHQQPINMCIAGFVLQSDEVGVQLAFERYEENTKVRAVSFIPRCNVVEERLLLDEKE